MKRVTSGFLFMLALVLAIPLGFIVAVNWWLESRFGASIAILSWGAAGGIICLLIGAVIVIVTQRITINGIADVLHDSSQAQKAQIGVYREYARSEREAFAHRAKLDVLDEKRIMKLADQQTRLQLQAAQQEPEDDDWYDSIQVEYKEVE